MTANLRVELLDHTPNPEQLVACAAKLCYSPVGVEGIKEGLDEEKISKFINMLMDLDHQSPIEHVSFTFAVEGVSRALTHQLVRHRMASYSQQSQRYVKLNQFEYIIPPEIEQIPKAREIYTEAMKQDQRTYDELVGILTNNHYERLIQEGMKEKVAKLQAEKKAIEDARYVFPNACETKIVFTMNARGLYNFFKHRCCNRAQWEIRVLSWEMLKLVKQAAPNLFSKVGPSCIDSPCPEGKMTCGQIAQVREKYRNIK